MAKRKAFREEMKMREERMTTSVKELKRGPKSQRKQCRSQFREDGVRIETLEGIDRGIPREFGGRKRCCEEQPFLIPRLCGTT
jgi:hypothetical protein